MKFTLTVQDSKGKQWTEDYDQPHVRELANAEKWAAETIARFNSTLYPGESPRTLIKVVAGELQGDTHDWEKTNIYTVTPKGKAMYDTQRCRVCGITGKRYGLASGVTLDREFAAKGFRSCKRALEILAKRGRKKATA